MKTLFGRLVILSVVICAIHVHSQAQPQLAALKPSIVGESKPEIEEADYSSGELKDNRRYPRMAELHGIGGEVKLNLHIDSTGKVLEVKVEEPVHPALDSEAVWAVMKTTFSPAHLKGTNKAVDSWLNLAVPFKHPDRPDTLAAECDEKYLLERIDRSTNWTTKCTMKFKCTVTKNGYLKKVESIKNTCNDEEFAAKVEAIVRSAFFYPAFSDGQRIESDAIVDIRFPL